MPAVTSAMEIERRLALPRYRRAATACGACTATLADGHASEARSADDDQSRLQLGICQRERRGCGEAAVVGARCRSLQAEEVRGRVSIAGGSRGVGSAKCSDLGR